MDIHPLSGAHASFSSFSRVVDRFVGDLSKKPIKTRLENFKPLGKSGTIEVSKDRTLTAVARLQRQEDWRRRSKAKGQ